KSLSWRNGNSTSRLRIFSRAAGTMAMLSGSICAIRSRRRRANSCLLIVVVMADCFRESMQFFAFEQIGGTAGARGLVAEGDWIGRVGIVIPENFHGGQTHIFADRKQVAFAAVERGFVFAGADLGNRRHIAQRFG